MLPIQRSSDEALSIHKEIGSTFQGNLNWVKVDGNTDQLLKHGAAA